MERILVTGSEGFIGRKLVESLQNSPHEVFGIDSKAGAKSTQQVDITSSSLKGVIKEIQPTVIVHLAAQIDVRKSFQDPLHDLKVNAEGTLGLLLASVGEKLKHFLYIHSGGAIYDSNSPLPLTEESPLNPQSPYGLTKQIGEGYVRVLCENSQVAWTSLALSNCFGPVKDHGRGVIYEFWKRLSEGAPCEIFGAENTRDFVYVDDVVRAINLAIPKPSNCRINISSGTEVSLKNLYEIMAEMLSSKQAPIIHNAKFGEVTRSCLSNEKAQQFYGWRPEIDFKVGLKLAIAQNSSK